MNQTSRIRRARPERRWRISPPMRLGSEALPGVGILQEVPGELGGLLWRSLRAVTLWAAVPAADRGALFAPGAQEERLAELLAVTPEPALEAPLATLAGLLGRAAQMRAEHVGLACTRIARWAQSRGALTTELEFVHAAALACPGDPRLALAVGRVTRDRGEYLQAETWYGRTVGLARQVADWETYARAYVGLGNMWVARGAFPAARKTLLKAARCAERRSIRDVHGMALHDLFVVEMECQRDEDGYRYAEAALRVYGSGHSLLPTLAHDVAYFWLARGRFGDALSVLRAMIPRIPAHRHVQVHGNIARAAGAIGDERTFEDASNAVRAASDEAPGKADALVEIARAALSLGRWERAEDAAEQALKIARARGEAKIVFVAEGVMESSRNEHAAHSASQCNAPGRKESTPAKETAAPFALNLVRSLEAIAVGA